MPTTDILRRIWHYASAARMGAIAETGDAVFAEFGIDDPKVVEHDRPRGRRHGGSVVPVERIELPTFGLQNLLGRGGRLLCSGPHARPRSKVHGRR
jgi:hypothetical protein